MELRRIKRQLSAAYHFSITRLALNYYMYYEICQNGTYLAEHMKPVRERYHGLLEALFQGVLKEEELEAFRAHMIREMDYATAYTDSFQAYEYVLNRLEGRFSPRLLDAREAFAGDDERVSEVMSYITSGRDNAAVNERIQTVLGQLPVRLTKQRFFGMVEEAMTLCRGGLKGTVDDLLYILRSEALLNQPKTAEPGFEELFELLQEFQHADYRQLTEADYRRLTGGIADAGKHLTDATGEIILMMDMVNDLYIQLLARPYALIDLTVEQQVREILSQLLAMFREGGERAIEQQLTEKLAALEGKQEGFYEQWLMDDAALAESKASGEREPAEEALRKVGRLMSSSSFMSLMEYDEKAEEPADDEYLKAAREAFFGELTEFWKEQPKVIVRASMAKVLSSLPVFFNSFDEVQDYCKGSLESCTDQVEKEACMQLIRSLAAMEEI